MLTATTTYAQQSAVGDFIVQDSHGRKLNVGKQKGKTILINFWALSCPPCKAEMAGINELHKRFANDTNVLFLLVDLDRDWTNSPAFMRENGYDLNVYVTASQVPETLFHGLLPTTAIIKSGKVIFFAEEAQDFRAGRFFNLLRQ